MALLLIVTAIKAQQPKMMLPIGHTSQVRNASFSPDDKKIVTASSDGIAKIWDTQSGALLINLIGHTRSISSVSFSPDGKKIVTASWDNTVKIWDAQSGELLNDLKGHTDNVTCSYFSPDGEKIVSASSEGTAKIWVVHSGALIANLKGHTSKVNSACFSPDGKKVVTASDDSTAKIWDATTGRLLANLKGHIDEVNSVCFSPNGKKIVTGSVDAIAKIWDVTTGKLLANLIGHDSFGEIYFVGINSACFSPDGNKILTASNDGTAKIWDAVSGALIADLKGHSHRIFSACFSTDGKKVVTASVDGSAKIWDEASGKQIAELKGHISMIFYACFSHDDKKVVTVSDDMSAKIWDARNGALLADLKGHSKSVESAAFSPDGEKIVTASDDGTAKIWDAMSGKLIATWEGHTNVVRSAAFSQDSKKIVTASDDSTAKIWDAKSVELLNVLKGHSNLVSSGCFSPDSRRIATASRDSTAKIWDAYSGMLLATLKGHTGPVWSVCFSPDGKKLLTASSNAIKIWDAQSGASLGDLNGHLSACFSADGKKIVTSWGNSAKIWDAQNSRLIVTLKGHTDFIISASFSPDSKKIVTASWDNSAKIWDAESGAFLVVLKGHTAHVETANFSPDGKKIVTASLDNTVKIWDAEKGDLLYTFFALNSNDYLIVDKDNRYDGTTGSRKLLYFTCGTEIIELDQVKDQLWVPNLAERINNSETINAKTLDELNICGLTPVVEDISIKADEYHFKILPRRGGLGETVLYLNGIEVKRYKPAELKNSGGTYELKIKKVALEDLFVAGKENRLTVKAFTSDNAISSRALNISEDKSKDKATAPNLFAVIVGVSDYKGDELDLKYPGKDATDISAVVSNAAKNLLNTDGAEHVFMYNLTTDKDHYQLPEKKSIKKVLEEIGNKATANDILLIFFAGHGVMRGSEDNKQFYFLTADASLNSSFGAVADVGISTSELTEWIKPANIKAQKRIMIFDACNSGQAIKDFVKLGNKEQGYVAARSDEKGQEIKAIEKLNNQSGLFILSASASNLAAYEMGRYSQGLLTYSLLKAVKQQPDILNEGKYLDVSKWFNAARETVSELSKETGVRQDPQIVSNTNFNIGVVNEEVMAKIVLSNEKPLFAACNFQNADENNPVDNLGLNKLIDQQLNSISSRGADAPIVYAGITSSAEAYSLSGRYNITGNAITIKVFIIQNKEVKQKIDLTGTKDKLDEFTALIATQAAAWAEKNK